MFHQALTATVGLVIFSVVAISSADAAEESVYRIINSSAVVSRPDPATGKQTPVPLTSLSSASVFKSDQNGGSLVKLTDDSKQVRSFSISADGSRLICYRIGPGTNQEYASELLIITSGGKVLKTIDLTGSGIRVLGAPVLLPDGEHIGLTACSVVESKTQEDHPAAVSTRAPPPSPTGRVTPKSREAVEGRANSFKQWELGSPPSAPFIATIDMSGENLKRIGAGAMAVWSPDGKTILFTDLKLDGAGPSAYRLYTMDAQGGNRHSVAPDRSACGSFSPDGKKIAYLTIDARACSVFVAELNGANAKKVTNVRAVFACPRWLDGKTLEVIARLADHTQQHANPGARNPNGFCFISTDNLELRALPNASHASIDLDNERLVFNMLPVEAGPVRAKVPPIEFEGTKVFTRDASGKRIPMPDGDYPYRGGVIKVRNGQSVIFSN